MNGFFNILKPPGLSSAAVVGAVKRLTGEKRVGHAGTLDPEAAGVLPVMVGRATRLFDYLVDKEKSYVAECAFGTATDTEDAQGTVIAEGSHYPALAECARAAARLTGDILQRPSVYSAIKQGGKPLYDRARRGEDVEAPLRPVHIERITLLEERPNHGLLLRVDCGRGTYIRSLCRDLGELTGCPAHMRFLLRTRSGAFTLAEAHTLEELAQARDEGRPERLLIPPEAPLGHLPAVRVKPGFVRLAASGTAPEKHNLTESLPASLPEGGAVRVFGGDVFLGIAARSGDGLRWQAVFPPEE